MTTLPQSIRDSAPWRGYRVWQRNRDVFLRSWKLDVGGFAVEPFVVLLCIGFGLGEYVESFSDLSYAEFVAPGIIASYAMFHATFDSTYGAYMRMETHHVYEAMLFTPIEPKDIVMGEVFWGATRSAISAAAVLVAALALGLIGSPWAVLAVPCAYLIGLAFASLSMILTATVTNIGGMHNFFTLVLTPMYFFSGVFFPLERLPEGVSMAAWALPLTPGVALVRGLATGELSWPMLLWALELAAFAAAATWLAAVLLRRRLIR